MQLRDTPSDYGTVTRWLHWLTATAIVLMLAIGWFAGSFPESTERTLMGFHVSLGVGVLGLGILRLLWRAANRNRPPRDADVLGRFATLVQWALIALLVIIPLSGWLMASAGGHTPGFFGLFSLPPLVAESDALHEFGEEVHEILPWILVGVLALHVVGALKHHYVDRDATLQRMVRSTPQ